MNKSLITLGSHTIRNLDSREIRALWGWHKFCAGPRVMRSGRALGNDGNEPWSKLAAPLEPWGPFLIPLQPQGSAMASPVCLEGGHPHLPWNALCGCHCCPEGLRGAVGHSGCALSLLQPPFHLQPLADQAAHGAQTLLLPRICR